MSIAVKMKSANPTPIPANARFRVGIQKARIGFTSATSDAPNTNMQASNDAPARKSRIAPAFQVIWLFAHIFPFAFNAVALSPFGDS